MGNVGNCLTKVKMDQYVSEKFRLKKKKKPETGIPIQDKS